MSHQNISRIHDTPPQINLIQNMYFAMKIFTQTSQHDETIIVKIYTGGFIPIFSEFFCR